MMETLVKAKSHMSRPFYANVYPRKVIAQSIQEGVAPRCIFLPAQELMRTVIQAVATKRPDETNEAFLLKFGLLEEVNLYLKYKPEESILPSERKEHTQE